MRGNMIMRLIHWKTWSKLPRMPIGITICSWKTGYQSISRQFLFLASYQRIHKKLKTVSIGYDWGSAKGGNFNEIYSMNVKTAYKDLASRPAVILAPLETHDTTLSIGLIWTMNYSGPNVDKLPENFQCWCWSSILPTWNDSLFATLLLCWNIPYSFLFWISEDSFSYVLRAHFMTLKDDSTRKLIKF